jgi:hypothetical protein
VSSLHRRCSPCRFSSALDPESVPRPALRPDGGFFCAFVPALRSRPPFPLPSRIVPAPGRSIVPGTDQTSHVPRPATRPVRPSPESRLPAVSAPVPVPSPRTWCAQGARTIDRSRVPVRSDNVPRSRPRPPPGRRGVGSVASGVASESVLGSAPRMKKARPSGRAWGVPSPWVSAPVPRSSPLNPRPRRS